MIYGVRTWMPFGLGLLAGSLSTLLIFSVPETPLPQISQPLFVDKSEHWEVRVQKTPPVQTNLQNPPPKVIRARFAATELGIREKLMVIMMAQSGLSVALNASLGPHISRLQIFADSTRIDADMAVLTNLISYRANGIDGQRPHMHVLNSIFDQALHENYDWFLFMPDTTYVNPFELNRLVNSMNWDKPLAMGHIGSEGNCIFQAGVLLSNAAVQLLIQQRHLCSTIVASNDLIAFEMCIRHATNLLCQQTHQDQTYKWWRVEESGETGSAVHDHVRWLASSNDFNSTLSVSPLLSEQDALSLHHHFIRVEMGKVDREIAKVTQNIRDFATETREGNLWPLALPGPSRPISRYQVPVWEYFTDLEIFKNEPSQNSRPLTGNDALDIREIISVGRKQLESDGFVDAATEFVKLRNGYRSFNARRGMEYVLDLIYRKGEKNIVQRVHVCRPIHSTELLHEVPYVKEDTDITIVVPVETIEEVEAAKELLGRHGDLCTSGSSMIDSRQTRVVIALRSVDQMNYHRLAEELAQLKRNCKSWQTDTAMLPLKPQSHAMIEAAALDEAIDHFGQQMIYVLMSPYADYQRELLDRIRINTIRHYQVFFPIPFAEFHPLVVNVDRLLRKANENEAKEKEEEKTEKRSFLSANFSLSNPEELALRISTLKGMFPESSFSQRLVVHKDRGFFDTNDFGVVSLYGVDYLSVREKLAQKAADGDATRLLDLSALFLGQSDIHLLRSIEPALRVRYHTRVCSADLSPGDFARCQISQKTSFGGKSQLANLMFGDLNKLSRFKEMATIH